MAEVTYENLIPRLLEAVPEFSADPEWVDDRLTYLVFGDLMRFAHSLLESDIHADVLRRIFNFVEEAAKTKNTEIEALLKDCLEIIVTREPEKAMAYMGKTTRKVFRRLEKEVYRGA